MSARWGCGWHDARVLYADNVEMGQARTPAVASEIVAGMNEVEQLHENQSRLRPSPPSPLAVAYEHCGCQERPSHYKHECKHVGVPASDGPDGGGLPGEDHPKGGLSATESGEFWTAAAEWHQAVGTKPQALIDAMERVVVKISEGRCADSDRKLRGCREDLEQQIGNLHHARRERNEYERRTKQAESDLAACRAELDAEKHLADNLADAIKDRDETVTRLVNNAELQQQSFERLMGERDALKSRAERPVDLEAAGKAQAEIHSPGKKWHWFTTSERERYIEYARRIIEAGKARP